MKNKINIFGTIVAFSALAVSPVTAQVSDTVRVHDVTHDTVRVNTVTPVRDTVKVVKETTVVHDTVTKPVKPKDNVPPFHRGEFGLRFMPTFSTLALRAYNGDAIQGTATVSYGYGAMLGFNMSRNFGIQAEVNYYEVTQSYKDQNLDRQVSVNYFNVPILLSLNTDKSRMVNLNIVAGPQFGINAGSSTKSSGSRDTDTLKAVVAVKQTDIGLAYGAGLDFMLNQARTLRLDLGYRGFYGLVDMNGNNTGNTYNVLIRGSRKTYGGYAGITFLF